jgi:hypothetical protein
VIEEGSTNAEPKKIEKGYVVVVSGIGGAMGQWKYTLVALPARVL